MTSSPSWEYFKTIHVKSIRNEDTSIYILKENENVIHFKIICKNDDHICPGGFIYTESNIIQQGNISYDKDNNRFKCILEIHEKRYLIYNIKDIMKSIISELFSDKYNSESSFQ